VIDAKTIVERLIAKKFPDAGRFLFQPDELVRLVRAVQRDAVNEFQRRGGSATSKAKAKAARANGAKGGRPRKDSSE